MAKNEHVAILNQGVAAWNNWRADSPNEKPDLSGHIFGEKTDQRGIKLGRGNLKGADLTGVNLERADLHGSDLRNSTLDQVVLT